MNDLYTLPHSCAVGVDVLHPNGATLALMLEDEGDITVEEYDKTGKCIHAGGLPINDVFDVLTSFANQGAS